MRALGQPVDPRLAQYGRGGTDPGWYGRKAVVDALCSSYLNRDLDPNVDVHPVPLDWINEQLAADGRDWRVRVLDDQYEFYLA